MRRRHSGLAGAVKEYCPVREAATGLEALEVCLRERKPYALFIGSDLGLLSGEMLGRKIRYSHPLDSIRLIGIQPPQLLVKARKSSPYEAVIMRSFVADVFREGFTSLLPRQGRLSGLLAALPDVKLLGIAAAEEALGAALERPVVLRPPTARTSISKSLVASVVLQAGPDDLPLCMQLSVAERGVSRLLERLQAVAAPVSATSIDHACPGSSAGSANRSDGSCSSAG